MKNYSSADIKRKITIEFVGEEGIDQGGLTREWFSLISREMFNENYALFVRSLNGVTFQPDPRSKVNPDHLQYFKFAGKVIGKVIDYILKILMFFIIIRHFLMDIWLMRISLERFISIY